MSLKPIETHAARKQANPVRLSDYVAGIFKTITSKKGMKKAIAKGLVEVDSVTGRTSTFIQGGENIVLFEEAQEKKPVANVELDVVFEDDYLAIINKPAGIVVSGNKMKSVVNALPKNLKKSDREDALKRPLPVHRLDFPTSGLLLVGKTTAAVTALGKLFEDKEIQKTYHAITIGEMKDKGDVKTPIEEKEAYSKFEVVERKVSGKYNGLNLVKLMPSTGRRHQLRIHMSSIGNPILGDKDYGKEGFILQGKGLFLHASSLEFLHPLTNDRININQPLPNKFRKLFPEESMATTPEEA